MQWTMVPKHDNNVASHCPDNGAMSEYIEVLTLTCPWAHNNYGGDIHVQKHISRQ